MIDDSFALLNKIEFSISYKISLPLSSLPATSFSPFLTSTSFSPLAMKLKWTKSGFFCLRFIFKTSLK